MSDILLDELQNFNKDDITEYLMGFGKLKLDALAYRLGIKNRSLKRKRELAEEIADVYLGSKKNRKSAVRKK